MGAHTALPTLTSDTRVFVWRGHDTLWLHITTAYDVAQYAASKHPFHGGMQQHGIVYYAQAWSLTWDGVLMFGEEIHAWKDGPRGLVPSSRRRVCPCRCSA